MLLYIAMLIGIVLAIMGAIFIERRGYTEGEEVKLREITYASPSIKIVTVIIRECTNTIAFVIVLTVLITSSLIASLSVNSELLTTVVNLETTPFYSIIAIANDIESVEYMKTTLSSGIIVVQVFKYVDVFIEENNKSYHMLPMLILCRAPSNLPNNLITLCNAVAHGRSVIDRHYHVHTSILIKGIRFRVQSMDLRWITNVEILPGQYIAHTLGVIGSSVIHVKDPKILVILPLDIELLKAICDDYCDLRVIMLDTDKRDIGMVKSMISKFSIVGYTRDRELILMSGIAIPSLQSLVSIVISIITSVLISVAASSGLIEKLRSLSLALMTQGVTSTILRVSLGMGFFTILTLFGLILTMFYTMFMTEIQALAGLVIYFVSSTTLSSVLSYRAMKMKRMAIVNAYPEGVFHTFEGVLEIEKFSNCIKSMFVDDEFFVLNEFERLEVSGNRFLMRIELMYRHAMAVLVSIEIEINRRDSVWIFKLSPEVWSFEEIEKYRIETIAALALSKASGGLRLCLES